MSKDSRSQPYNLVERVCKGPIPLVLLIQLLSFYAFVPFWLSVLLAGVAIFTRLSTRLLPGMFRFAIIVSSVCFFALYYQTNFSVEMAAAFLLLSATLKLLEIRKQKDLYVFVFVMLYLSSVSFLFSQHFAHTLLQIAQVAVCFYALLSLTGARGLVGAQWQTIGKAVAFSIPLVVILFLFFPRISPLWSIPIKTQDAISGVTDSMTPGEIAKLGKSSERAFRVQFNGDTPAKRDLYWRGIVLDSFDGETWSKSRLPSTWEYRKKMDTGTLYPVEGASYQVMLEPNNQTYVFVLEGSAAASSNLITGPKGQFFLKNEAIQPTRYQMELKTMPSALPEILGGVSLDYLNDSRFVSRQDLQVPKSGNPRSKAFVQEMIRRNDTPLGFVNAVLTHFREESFFYTLEPDPISGDFVDGFLFETRRGFCAHFAGSFAYLMRMAGIPARVIVGYQGGEASANGEYLIVHQFDAHAWVELELPDYSWIRVDPTSMVAPQRIESSLRDAVTESEFLSEDPFGAASHRIGALNWLRLKLDDLNYQWQNLVVNFNQQSHTNLVSRVLGEYSLERIVLVLFSSFAAISVFVILWFWFNSAHSRHTRSERIYLRWLWLIRWLGYSRLTAETPKAFLGRQKQSESNGVMGRFVIKRTERLTQQLYKNDYEMYENKRVNQSAGKRAENG